MPSRTVPLVNGEYYHVFNRGVAKMPIFLNRYDYKRFRDTFLYYQIFGPKPKFSEYSPKAITLNNKSTIVEIVAYCLMPNHFHFLLRQTKEDGITEFISKLCNSYTKYFNKKNNRVGPILQGEFKSVFVEDNNQLLHLTRYIHLNPLIGYVTKNLETYPWSSFLEYVGLENTDICAKSIVFDQFKALDEYKQFVLDQTDYAQQLEKIKHLSLDYEQ